MNVHVSLNGAPLRSLEIENLDALRAIADGQRHRIVTFLMDETLTARELAERLGIARTRLYHHLAVLERHRLIEVADRRIVSGIEERSYRAVARTFRVNRALLASQASESQIADAQATILESLAADLRERATRGRAQAGNDDDVLVSRIFLRLNEARHRQLRSRIAALLDEYREADADGREAEFGIAFFTTERET